MHVPKGISCRYGLVGILACSVALVRAHADDSTTPLVQPSPSALIYPEGVLSHTNGMYGWGFWLLQPVLVAGVGWYDEGRDGLLNSHEIGLWTGSPYNYTSLVFSASVPAGETAPLAGDWRKLDFNVSLTLQPGFYVVGGTYHGVSDDPVEYVQGFMLTVDPRVFTSSTDLRTITPRMALGGGFRAPDEGITSYGAELGPTLFVEPIPEASPSRLFALGLGLWLAARAGRSGLSGFPRQWVGRARTAGT